MLKQRWEKDVNPIQANNYYLTIPTWDLSRYFVVDNDV